MFTINGCQQNDKKIYENGKLGVSKEENCKIFELCVQKSRHYLGLTGWSFKDEVSAKEMQISKLAKSMKIKFVSSGSLLLDLKCLKVAKRSLQG